MQANLQIFDLPINGTMSGHPQKIAIKMEGQKPGETADSEDFASIMETLMALSPEELKQSLRQLEWVPIEEGDTDYAPLIDLTTLDGNSEQINAILARIGGEAMVPVPLETMAEPGAMKDAGGHEKVLNKAVAEEAGKANSVMRFAMAVDAAAFDKGAEEGVSRILIPEDDETSNDVKIKMPAPGIHTSDMEDGDSALSKVNADWKNSKNPMVDALTMKEPKTTEQLKPGALNATPDPLTDDETAQLELPFKKAPASSEGKDFIEKAPTKAAASSGHVMPIKAEQFRTRSDGISVSLEDEDTEADPQIKSDLKETMRLNMHKPSRYLNENKSDGPGTQAQSNRPVKETSAFFSSRWGTMLEKSADRISETKTMDSGADPVDRNDIIRQIVERMTLKNSRLHSRMNIKLKPEFLGNIRMQITSDNQQVAVRLVADSGAVKEMIEQNLHYLKTELQQHGLQIHKFDVSVGGGNEDLHQEQQTQWQQHSRQRGEGRMSGQNENSMHHPDNDQSEDRQTVTPRPAYQESEIDYFA